jgi:hypothetical protein
MSFNLSIHHLLLQPAQALRMCMPSTSLRFVNQQYRQYWRVTVVVVPINRMASSHAAVRLGGRSTNSCSGHRSTPLGMFLLHTLVGLL